MKTLTAILLTLIVISLGSCNILSGTENDGRDTASVIIDSSKISSYDTVQIKYLYDIFKNQPVVEKIKKLDDYVMNPNKISNETQLIDAYILREEVKKTITESLIAYIEEHIEINILIENELNKIGLQGIYAEGYVLDIGFFPYLENQLNKYGSEIFKLYTLFTLANSDGMSGEYPNAWQEPDQQMVIIAEEMQKKYPEHEYTKSIEQEYKMAVRSLTDVYKAGDMYITGGDLSCEAYPGMADINTIDSFAIKNPGSKIAPALKKICANMSEISDCQSNLRYLVVVKVYDDSDQCSDAIVNFILSGKDIPHTYTFKKNSRDKFAAVYRIYSDKTKAEKALQQIKGEFTEAFIYETKVEVVNQ